MTSTQPASPADQDVPLFTSRSERKRFLREHDLPADISTAAIPIVLAQREAGVGGEETSQEDAPTPQEDAHTDDVRAAEAPAAVEVPDSTDSSDSTWSAASTESPDSAGWPESAAVPDNSESSATPVWPSGAEAGDDTGTPGDAAPVDGLPSFDLARRRVDAYPTGPDFETSSTAVITPSALGDFDAPLRRRSPVVKPPTGANIRVVTGALPIVRPEDLDDNPPTTPLSAIDESALSSGALGTGTFSTSSRAAGPATAASAPAADPWTRAGLADDEEEDSDELDEPPAKPMSARSVTHEDGTILVAERNSMVPYIVLGAAGFVALALVVIALLLLL